MGSNPTPGTHRIHTPFGGLVLGLRQHESKLQELLFGEPRHRADRSPEDFPLVLWIAMPQHRSKIVGVLPRPPVAILPPAATSLLGESSAETWPSLPVQRHPRGSNRVGEGGRANEELSGIAGQEAPSIRLLLGGQQIAWETIRSVHLNLLRVDEPIGEEPT